MPEHDFDAVSFVDEVFQCHAQLNIHVRVLR